MKRLLLIVASFLCVCAVEPAVRACSCAEYGTPVCAAYGRADVVFVGQITDIKVAKDSDGDPVRRMHFVLNQRFKGDLSAPVVVFTTHGTSCDRPFEKGKRYLIYAWRSEETNQLHTGACTRTTLLEHAEEDLEYLRKVTQQTVDQSISGLVRRGGYQNLSGLRVTVDDGKKTLETFTSEAGEFSFSLPGPGTFKVRVFAPFAAEVLTYSEGTKLESSATDKLTTVEYKLKLDKAECHYAELNLHEIDLHATASIAGYVLTESGTPLSQGKIYLVNAAKPEGSGEKEFLKADGSFKFGDLPAGEYYLVMNSGNEAPGESDAPYPKTYYPGVGDRSEAVKIVLNEGTELGNLTLRLGPPLRERIVSGIITWENGRALKDVHLTVYDATRYVRRIQIDKTGKFEFKIYGDFLYVIQADTNGETHPGRSERLVLIDENTTGLKLILRPVKE